ncbi:MAG: rRNA maturation RNase YbeY [Chloroflexota bacterium]
MEIIMQIDEPVLAEVNPDLIEQALPPLLLRLTPPGATTMTVVVTDDPTVQELNRQYRGINAPTDVLSFGNTPDPDFPDIDQGHLGDVVIAYPTAQRQALAAGHAPMDEILLLAVHGALHLLGFDHDTLPHQQKMWAVQQEIMAGLGLAHLQPTES